MRWFLAMILACCLICCFCPTAEAQPGNRPSAETPSYECQCVENDMITIDGRLVEPCWEAAPIMQFRVLHEGSEPPLETFTRLVWDAKHIYVGFDVRDPNVWARAALRDDECSEDYARRAFLHDQIRSREWSRLECNVMYFDTFVKAFLDPDMDGKQYVEFQINPVNSIFDAWYDQGFIEKWGDQERGPHVSWTCPGLITAVSVEGTLNAPHDVDKGWCVEMAIPWEALAPFAEGACPPKAGDVWGALFGRAQKESFTAKDANWMWPAIDKVGSHMPSTYGRLVFSGGQPRFTRLMAWGARGDPEEFVPKAADIGVTDILSGSQDPEYLAGLVKVAKAYEIDVYAVVTLNANTWKGKYPDKAAPVQQMNEEENEILAALGKPEARRQSEYQWGEEPLHGREVLLYDLLCFHHPEVKKMLKEQIRDILAVRGITGIAFDGFGYRNYRCCRCPFSTELFEEKQQAERRKTGEKALERFSLDTLVDFNNELADYARSIKRDVKITNHVWPVYLPERLYGNRLDIDYCGQTAAWFFPWDLAKVKDYARAMVVDEKKYHPRANAAALIGFYNKPDIFPLKSAKRVAAELDAILAGGCTRVQVCDITDVIDTPEIAAVFRGYFKQSKRP